jgi:hypothetical protein
MANPTTVEELLNYWPGNIPFKGSLVSEDGSCMCAQGQALHFLDGMSADDLRNLEQAKADKRIAELFGISRAHAVLLRIVNDRQDGAPACVIRNPEQVLGDQAQAVLAFWRHLDRMTAKDWTAARYAARNVACDAAGATNEIQGAAGAAAWAAAAAAAGATNEIQGAARNAARDASGAAAGATNEIQGAAVMRAKGVSFFYLPLFGFADPKAVLAADKT